LRVSVALIGVATLLLVGGAATAAPPTLQLVEAGSGFSMPVYVTATSADPTAIYVVEQTGTIERVVGGVTDPTPFLDISSSISGGGERGLLSMAFSPSYASDHLFYAYYTDTKGRIVVAQFQTSLGNPPKKLKTLLKVNHPHYANHNGGQLEFGPDGMLYAGTGDGGGGGDPGHNGQKPKGKLAKLLRAAGPKFNKWEITGYGLRNPWRFSFDSTTGDLYIGDVGQGNREEVDYRTAANLATPANYGWNRYEGTQDYDNGTTLKPTGVPVVSPVQEYDHASGDCAIIGGYVYRGSAMADEVGRYFYSDLCTGMVWSMAAGGGDNRIESITVNTPSSFGLDAAGELYVASLGDGKVYRLSE
jgi:hypothetical protein